MDWPLGSKSAVHRGARRGESALIVTTRAELSGIKASLGRLSCRSRAMTHHRAIPMHASRSKPKAVNMIFLVMMITFFRVNKFSH